MANRQSNIDPKAMVKNLASRGVALPRHEQRKQDTAVEMHHLARQRGDLEDVIRRHYSTNIGGSDKELDHLSKNNEIARQMGLSRMMHTSGRRMESSRRREKTAGIGSSTSGAFMDDVSLALPRFYDPLEFWDVAGLPWNMADEGHRHKLHKWLRLYYATHYLVPILIDIFTRFPLVGMDIECSKDTQIAQFYQDLFLDKLDYENFLVSIGREFWCAPPGEKVKTRDGYKPIEDIQIGEYVLTHKGRYRKVLKTSERPYKGKIRTITPYKGKPTTFTHGHEIFTGIMSGHLDIDEQWTPIEELSKGDYVCIPRDPESKWKGVQSWTPVKKVEDKDYDGPVYNLEVEEDHSYVTSIAVHNCVGEAFAMGSFDEDLGVWSHEELLNPEDIVIKNFPLLDSSQMYIVPPAYLTKLAREKAPAREYKMLQMQYAELIPYLLKNEHIPISGVLLKQIGNKLTDWDDHGTPILLRSLRTLMHEEKLWASQEAVAERLYSPFILAKVGIQDLGDGQPPWIPEPEHLEIVRDDIDLALASDFRLMVHHFGIDIQNVFGREQMPRLGDDFDRVERRILMTFGVNPSLLSAGAATQPYASSALQAEFLNQMLRTYQGILKNHFLERAAIVAEAQEHYDFEKRGQTRVPLYEEVVIYDEEGNKHIETRPKLLLPDIKFDVLDLRDEATERQFMQALRAQGVPISDERLMVGVDFSTKEEAEKYNEETVQKTVIQQEAKFKAYTILKKKNLPIPPELAAEVEGVLLSQPHGGMAGGAQQPDVVPGGQQGPAQMPGGGKGGAPAQLGPGGIGNPMGGGGAPPATPEPASGPTGGSTAPPVSMERRQGLPRPASSVQKQSTEDSDDPLKEKNKESKESAKISPEAKKQETIPDKIVEKLPKHKTSTKKRYTIIDEDQRISNTADDASQE